MFFYQRIPNSFANFYYDGGDGCLGNSIRILKLSKLNPRRQVPEKKITNGKYKEITPEKNKV